MNRSSRIVGFAGLVCGLGWLAAAPQVAYAQKLVYVVRHAERADGGAPAASMSGAPADPLLSPAGQARAAKLATMLAEAGIAAIYATEFHRTQDTAKPLAGATHVPLLTFEASQTAALIADLKKKHAKDIVLVVAHSNTMPAIVKALGGPDVTVGDNDYDGIFVVVPATGATSKIKY